MFNSAKTLKVCKTLATALLLSVTASALFAPTAQARQLYWTGQGSGQTVGQCQANAAYDGAAGARQSCINDYGISAETCYSAPIVNTQNMGVSAWGNSLFCQVRVFIYVP